MASRVSPYVDLGQGQQVSCHKSVTEQQECRRTELGYDYRGDVSVSASGRECNAWDDLGHRSCRNFPDTPDRVRPWCYTNITFDLWEYCDIPFCKREPNTYT